MDPFLNSLMPLASAAEMNAWDKAAIEFGIPEIMLMENAGHALREALADALGPMRAKRIVIFTGPGNNGGDGFCLARLLADDGALPFIFSFRKPEEFKGAAAFHAQLAIKADVPVFELESEQDNSEFCARIIKRTGALPHLLLDCLLGTGLTAELTQAMLHLVEDINLFAARMRCKIVGVDIPSGLNSETGNPMPNAINAILTITLAAPKLGMLLPQAARYCGKILCREIGIPACIRNALPPRWRLLDGRGLANFPDLPENSFKNRFGHVLVIGGANGYAGAGHLACAGALRAGCGLVSAYAPAECLDQLKDGWPEIMTRPACIGREWLAHCLPDLDFASCVVIGPGFTRNANAAELLENVLQRANRPPCVIDADALILLSENEALLAQLRPDDVLTPHPGEAGALLHCSGARIQTDRFLALDELCAKTPAAIVLKGAGTLVGQGKDMRLLCPYDIPELAIGGAGDVLAGCIGALICQQRLPGYSTISRASLGVILHALAGLKLARAYPRRGFTASQLADMLPQAWDFSGSIPEIAGETPWPKRL